MGFFRLKPGHPDYLDDGIETIVRKWAPRPAVPQPLSKFMRKLTGTETMEEFMRTDFYDDEPRRKTKSGRGHRRAGTGN
jgi:hypothetical protein